MAALLPLAAGLLPSLLGPVFHKIIGDGMEKPQLMTKIGGQRRRMMRMRRGRGAMIGGTAMIGGRYRRGKGFTDTMKRIAERILHYGKKAHAIYKNKHVRSLINHGINTFKTINEKGLGRRRRRIIKQITRNRMAGGAIEAPPGPLA